MALFVASSTCSWCFAWRLASRRPAMVVSAYAAKAKEATKKMQAAADKKNGTPNAAPSTPRAAADPKAKAKAVAKNKAKAKQG